MKLPTNYLEVGVKTLNNKFIGNGILNRNNKIHSLYLFTERDGVLIYTQSEIKENFQLYNPKDGIGYGFIEMS